jgi:hypothetical protein
MPSRREKPLLDLGMQRVAVACPPEPLRRKAEALGEAMELRVGGYTCGDNSYVLALAARELQPSADVRIIGGFAFGRGSRTHPAAHVWVRVGETHFDITWSRFDSSLSGCEYFQAFDRDIRTGVLQDVELFAAENGIETV